MQDLAENLPPSGLEWVLVGQKDFADACLLVLESRVVLWRHVCCGIELRVLASRP